MCKNFVFEYFSYCTVLMLCVVKPTLHCVNYTVQRTESEHPRMHNVCTAKVVVGGGGGG